MVSVLGGLLGLHQFSSQQDSIKFHKMVDGVDVAEVLCVEVFELLQSSTVTINVADVSACLERKFWGGASDSFRLKRESRKYHELMDKLHVVVRTFTDADEIVSKRREHVAYLISLLKASVMESRHIPTELSELEFVKKSQFIKVWSSSEAQTLRHALLELEMITSRISLSFTGAFGNHLPVSYSALSKRAWHNKAYSSEVCGAISELELVRDLLLDLPNK